MFGFEIPSARRLAKGVSVVFSALLLVRLCEVAVVG